MKYLGIIITVLAMIFGAIYLFGRLEMRAEKTEEVVEKHEEEIDTLEEFSYKQTIMMEQIQQQDMRQSVILEKLEKKL